MKRRSLYLSAIICLTSILFRLPCQAACAGQPPLSAITSPGGGTSVPYPTNLTIQAAASDSDGSVVEVEFYAGTNLLGSTTSSPFEFVWSNALAGTHALTVVAVDDAGCRGTSTVASVKVGIISPLELAGLKLWLDAGTGVTVNAGLVSQWADQSGQANHAAQNSGSLQPSLQPEGINGLPAIRFDGSDDRLSLVRFPATNTFSIYVVARALLEHEIDNERLGVFSPVPGGSGQRYLFGDFENVGTSVSAVGLSFGTNGASVYEYSHEPVGPPFHNSLATYKGAEGASFTLLAVEYRDRQPFLYVNGALARIGLRSPRAASILSRTFGGGNASGQAFSGDIAEVLVYDRLLSADEAAAVARYFNDKYRLYTWPGSSIAAAARPLSPTQIMVTWQQPGTNTLRDCIVERRAGAGTFSPLTNLENRSVFLDANAVAGETYGYRIRAHDFAGLELVSAEAPATTPMAGTAFPASRLKLWLQAGSGHESGSIGTWSDLSGSTNFAGQWTVTNRPVGLPAQANGRPAVRFNGFLDQLELQAYTASNNFTVMAVARTADGHELDAESIDIYNMEGATGQRYLFGGEYQYNDFAEVGLSLGTNGYSLYEFAYNAVGNNQFSPSAVWAGAVGTNFNLLTFTYSNQQPHQYLNGAWVHTGLRSQRSGSVFARSIGFGNGYGQSPFGGDLAEVMVFEGQLSLTELDVINQYLNGTYAFAPPSIEPIALAAVPLSASEVALAWRQAGTNTFSSYIVQRRVGTSGPFTAIGQVGADWRFIDTSASPLTTYSYQVHSVFNAGANDDSNIAVVQTPAAGPPFPFNGLASWLRAEDIAATNGESISVWADYWNATHSASQGSPPDQPQWQSAAFNGRSAVRFAGGTCLILPDVLSSGAAGEIFVAVRSSTANPATSQGFWKFNASAPTYYPAAGGGVQDAFGSTAARASINPFPDLTSPVIYDVAAAAGLWRSRMNGTVKRETNNNTVSFSGNPLLGRSTGGAAEPFDGDVAELLIFNRVLGLDEQKAVRDYLAQKFSIILDHPHLPANLTLTRLSPTTNRLAWTALVGSENGLESFFAIDRRPDSNATFAALQTLARTNTAFVDASGLPELNYDYQFRVANDVGEVFSFPLTAPGTTDSDGDGLPDYLEILLGTNPNSAHTDGDGLPDGWEIRYGLNPRRADGRFGASGDFDNDGRSNLLEYQTGTHPADGMSGDNSLVRLQVFRPR